MVVTDNSHGIPFLKMDGAGNDFVVIDNRSGAYGLDEAQRIAIADRRSGVGCDQIVLLEKSEIATVFMRLYNADGGEVGACGNATRCVAWLVIKETGKDKVSVETKSGVLHCSRAGDAEIRVNMGAPRFDWREIPLAREVDALNLPLTEGMPRGGIAVSMGNPHAVFFVEEISGVSLETLGPKIEHAELFPERTNVEFAAVENRGRIRLRVWERGAGETRACGTGACATMVAARLKGLVDESVVIQLAGGDLRIEWQGETRDSVSSVFMTGPVSLNFNGVWNPGKTHF